MEQEINPNNKPLVATKKTNKLYLYNGEDKNGGYSFTNLEDNKTGIITKEQASNYFKVPLELNEVCLQYPNVINLFKAFNGDVLVEKDGIKKHYKV
jgi:hypothetical protein